MNMKMKKYLMFTLALSVAAGTLEAGYRERFVRATLSLEAQIALDNDLKNAINVNYNSKHDMKKIQDLLLSGANPNSELTDGNTLLDIAARYGYTEVAEVLLKFGANAFIKNDDDETAYSIAQTRNNTGIVALIDSYTKTDRSGNTSPMSSDNE